MNILLTFFAFPVSVIILSAIFQTIINCPIKIAGITFAIFLIITFAFFDETFLIATIIYTILSFLVALLVSAIQANNDNNGNENDNDGSTCSCNRGISQIIENESDNKVQYCNYRRYR